MAIENSAGNRLRAFRESAQNSTAVSLLGPPTRLLAESRIRSKVTLCRIDRSRAESPPAHKRPSLLVVSLPLVPLFPLLVGASVSKKKLRSDRWQHPSRDLVPRSGLIKPKRNGNIHLIGRMNDDERTFRRLLFGRLFFRCAPIQSRHFGRQLRLTLRAADGRSPIVPKLLHPNGSC